MNPELLRAHADCIRAAQMMGRSELMQRLCDFLMTCSLADKAPNEIEIAIDVFGKDASFAVTQDAMVRVYVYELRRKLQEYYSAPQTHLADRVDTTTIWGGSAPLRLQRMALPNYRCHKLNRRVR